MPLDHPDDEDSMRTRKTPDGAFDDMRTRRTPPYAGTVPSGGSQQEVAAGSQQAGVVSESLIAGKYVVVRRLAEGGFGVVFEGYYTINGNRIRVAIKLLHASKHLDHATAIRFHEEVRTLCLLQHPNVCRVIDGGMEPGTDRPFLVMDYADGGTLKRQLQDAPEGHLKPQQVIQWFEEAARGLLAAEKNVDHDGRPAPIFHRDVKPENLLLQRGRVVVADFGAARLGGDFEGVTSEVVPQMWTPAYGSPEQDGGSADHRSDIYGLGTSMFHLLTGEITARRFENAADRFQHAHDPSERLASVPRELGAIVRKMTEPKVLDRYQSFEEVLADLELLKVRPVPKWPRLLLAAVAAAALLVTGLEVSGVTDWIGTKVVELRQLGEVRAECDELLQRAQQLQARDWRLLADLRQRVALVADSIRSNRELLSKVEGEHRAADRVAMPAGFVSNLAAELATLAAHTDDLMRQREELTEASVGLASQSVDSVVARLADLRRHLVDLPFNRELLLEQTRVEAEVEGLRQVRDKLIATLEARFEAGQHEGLAAEAVLAAQALATAQEQRLAAEAQAVADRVVRAQQLSEQVLTWPDPSAVGPLQQIGRLQEAMERLAEQADHPDLRADTSLSSWFDHKRTELSKAWLAAAATDLSASLQQVQAQVAAFNLEAAASDLQIARRMALEQQRAQLAARREQVSALQDELLGLAKSYSLSASLPAELLQPVPLLAGAAVVDLSVYRELAEDRQYDLDVAEQPPPLRGLAESVRGAWLGFGDALKAVGPRPSREQWRQLDELRRTVYDANELLSAGRKELANYQRARAEMAARSCADLMATCSESEVARRCPALEQERVQLVAEIRVLEQQRQQQVRGPIENLRAGKGVAAEALLEFRAQLQAAVVALGACDETQWVTAAENGLRAIDAAMARLAALQQWLPTQAPSAGEVDGRQLAARRVSDLKALLDTIDKCKSIADEQDSLLLSQWWQGYRQGLATVWCQQAAVIWRALHDSLVARCAAESKDQQAKTMLKLDLNDYRELHARLQGLAFESLGQGLREGPVFEEVPALAEQAASSKPLPEGWSATNFDAPDGIRSRRIKADDAECQRLFSPQFLEHAEQQGLRLWYFDARVDRDGNKIYMTLCVSPDRQRAELIDVLPVTFAEISVREYISDWSYWNRSRAFRTMPKETIAYNSTQSDAREFARMVSARVSGVTFGLPADDYRDWPCAMPHAAVSPVARADTPPLIRAGTVDVSVGGLCYLCTGVREWTAGDMNAVGVSSLEPSSVLVPRRRDTGWRLAISLPVR